MFAGIGGFRSGLTRAGGFQCVGHCEIDKYANASYTAIYEPGKEERYYPDATKIDPADLPDFELLCGGFPCQAFSNAGRRRGFADARGTLFFEIARLAQAKRPAYLLLENVPGLLSHDKGKTFSVILSALDDLGYHVEWSVLNSKHFGVPQSRRRLFIIGYSQIFQTLYYCADQIHHGALPCHVHFILDEAPSVNLPGLPRELATMRSRNISCSTIIQNMAQIKELYKDSWETIPGNSDTLLYLGGNEASTHKYISEALGKSTIDTKTHGQTKGRSGSYSTNFQISGRELLTPDEVRMLDNRYCILFIRGTRPVMDEKYELMEHPAIRYTMDGGGPPYIHHGTVEPPITGEPLFQIDFDNEKENAAA